MQLWHSPCFALSRWIEEVEDPETSPDERSPTVITSPALPLIKQSGSAPSVLVAGIFFSHLSGFPEPSSAHITGVCNYILIFILKGKELPFKSRSHLFCHLLPSLLTQLRVSHCLYCTRSLTSSSCFGKTFGILYTATAAQDKIPVLQSTGCRRILGKYFPCCVTLQ